jgi:hypothetical protein
MIKVSSSLREHKLIEGFFSFILEINLNAESMTRVLKETMIQKLLVFDRKILRRIFGRTKENQIWRIKTPKN